MNVTTHWVPRSNLTPKIVSNPNKNQDDFAGFFFNKQFWEKIISCWMMSVTALGTAFLHSSYLENI